jgi:hypothetical protein
MEAQGYLITRDRGGKCYREWRHIWDRPIDTNLSIFYAKVNDKGRVCKDPKKNVNVECWLEFGNLEWGYGSYDPNTEEPCDWDVETVSMNYHDPDLDCGAPTFDEALIKLAKLVLKKYGDYTEEEGDEMSDIYCGHPVCADCKESHRALKELGLSREEGAMS